MSTAKNCPGCGSPKLSPPFVLPNQPVILNYRYDSPEKARAVERRDMALSQCADCGMVFNATFDPSVVPYDEKYENRQCFSPAFQEHLRSLASELTARNSLQGGRIIEVGCGKGDFLKLICREARASGVGYDTSFEGELACAEANIRFHRSYVFAADIRERFDAVICRHVIEHVPNVGAFLIELRAIAAAAGDPVVVIETPGLEWITQNGCFWDVFYEHCNYFSLPCLEYLARRAGFRVVRHSLVFGGQYQLLELRAAAEPVSTAGEPPGIPARGDLGTFSSAFEKARRQLEETLLTAGADREGWAIWGAGAKGVAIVNQTRLRSPECVIDSNPAKHGCFIPGSNVRVVSPEDPCVLKLPVILVANPNYAAEIESFLVARGFRNKLLRI